MRKFLAAFLLAGGLVLVGASPALAKQPFPLNYHTFDLSGGTANGLTYSDGALSFSSAPAGTFSYTDPYAGFDPIQQKVVDGSGDYDYGTWTSPQLPLSFGFNELVSSWNAQTPVGTWVQSEVRPLIEDSDGGHWAKWYILGRWTSSDSDFHRTSVGGQGDADGFVSIDTFFTKDHPAIAYQLRLTLYRRVGLDATPTVTRYSAIASNLTNQKNTFPSQTTMDGQTIDLGAPDPLAFPSYSQELHHGEYPQFDSGGEAWCSPTSSAMVVGYWNAAPPASAFQYVYGDYPNVVDPVVDYTARMVFDYHYDGAGNWPFNTAYAASQGLVADVTQLHDLSEAEAFIKDGIPLVASVAWHSNKLDGGIKSTNGHLLVIGGFTGDGDVIAYDPASTDDGAVRHVYDREQFERAWIPASGGIVYVDRPAGWPTPELTANNS
ncbi:MAG TPA: C39 family peptidase [Gaiellaceae bacterium]|nr:C39 family peptidase [Gaiellaceae bacterium]